MPQPDHTSTGELVFVITVVTTSVAVLLAALIFHLNERYYRPWRRRLAYRASKRP